MENVRYMQSGIDLKRMLLLLKKKLWLVVAAVVTGAVLGGGIYLLYHLVLTPEREYQSVSKLYLNFNCEPEDYNQLAYNGYTWNDLMITDPILDYTMEGLPAEVSRDAVIEATKAEILSDIRLLTITITAGEPELVAQIMQATQEALVHLGETDELFHSIEVYSTTEPEQIVWDNRTVRAIVTGAVMALVIVSLVMAFYYVLDDSVYVANDAEKRYGVPVVGIFTTHKSGMEQRYGKEFLANYRYMSRNMKSVSLVSADDKADAQAAGNVIEQLLSGETMQKEQESRQKAQEGRKEAQDRQQRSDKGSEASQLVVCGMPEEDIDNYRRMRETDGVLLAVRYGSGNGKCVERMLSNLEKQDCRVLGIVIVGADEKFLGWYYLGRKFNES